MNTHASTADANAAGGPRSDGAWIKLALLASGVTPDPSFDDWFVGTAGFAERRNVYNSPVWDTARTDPLPQEIRLPSPAGLVTAAVNVYGPSPWQLACHGGEPVVTNASLGIAVPVRMVRDLETVWRDEALARTCNLYGGSALSFFSPRTCYFFTDTTECRFCSLAGTAAETSFSNRLTPAEVNEAVMAVAAHEPDAINQVMIVGGNERNLDKGFRNHLALVRAASDALAAAGLADEVSVHLVTMPPRDLALIGELVDVPNVHAGFNLEAWDPATFQRIAPGKAADYGFREILAALEVLRDAVGAYRAHSILIAGLEPPASTLAGARMLADSGISPIINVYHSDVHSRLGLSVRPSYRELAEVACGLQDVYDTYPVQPYWKGCGRNALDFEASQGMFRGTVPDFAGAAR